MVTSGGVAPTLKSNIGLGYVTTPLTIGEEVFIKVRDRLFKAEVVKRPFVPKTNKLVK